MISDTSHRSNPDLVLLIHGTNSASLQSDYPANSLPDQRWWQRGSPFWDALVNRLRDSNVSLPPPGFWSQHDSLAKERNIDHFWWSGANREQDRRKAAIRLAKVLHQLKQKNIGVHLIGHSHGGSIIQSALIQAELTPTGKRLDNIRSVSSVGTPFIDFRPHPWGWLWFILAVFLFALIRVPFADVSTSMWEFTRQPDRSYDGSGIIDLEWLYATTARWSEAIAQEHNPLTYVPLPICLIVMALSTFFFYSGSSVGLESFHEGHV